MLKTNGFCAAFLTLLAVVQDARSESTTPRTDQAIEILGENQRRTLADYLPALPKQWFKNYALIYRSRSLQSASLERPRVVSADPSMNFFFAFRETDPRSEVETFEAIETYGNLPPQFLRITFGGNGQRAVVEKNPAICSSCHALEPGKKELGFIWDNYPQWPGVYGSIHPNFSSLRIPHFEREAFARFQKSAPLSPVYQVLEHLGQLELDDYNHPFVALNDRNNIFHARFRAFHLSRSANAMGEIADRFEPLAEIIRFTNECADHPANVQNPLQLRFNSEKAVFLPEMVEVSRKITADDSARFRKTLEDFGDDADRVVSRALVPFLYGYDTYPPFSTDPALKKYPYVSFNLATFNGGNTNTCFLFSPYRDAFALRHADTVMKLHPLPVATRFDRNSFPFETAGAAFTGILRPENLSEFSGNPETAFELKAWVPNVFQKFGSAEIRADPFLVKWASAIEREVIEKASSLPPLEKSKLKDAITPVDFKGFGEEFWKSLPKK